MPAWRRWTLVARGSFRISCDASASCPCASCSIEDHQALREGLELLLSREGLEVVGTTGSASEGRELVERR